ncbi:MAG: hypothetical protein QOH91_3332, partial [Mycobacterium sp.]|nr:hypothetical protein [Mycobacterium sp.]
ERAGESARPQGAHRQRAAWIWLQQAQAAHGTAGDFYEGKRLAARYFFHYELPKTTAQFDLLDSGDQTTTDLDENCF